MVITLILREVRLNLRSPIVLAASYPHGRMPRLLSKISLFELNLPLLQLNQVSGVVLTGTILLQ